MSDLDLDAIERRIKAREPLRSIDSYMADYVDDCSALSAEVRALRERVATLEAAMRDHLHDHGDCRVCRALLDASHDQDAALHDTEGR